MARSSWIWDFDWSKQIEIVQYNRKIFWYRSEGKSIFLHTKNLLYFLVAKLLYKSKCLSVHMSISQPRLGGNVIFSAPIWDIALIFFVQILLMNEHLFCKYFVRLSVGNATKLCYLWMSSSFLNMLFVISALLSTYQPLSSSELELVYLNVDISYISVAFEHAFNIARPTIIPKVSQK